MRKLVIGIVLLGVLAAIGATANLMSIQETTTLSPKAVRSTTTTPAAQAYINQGKSYLQAHNILAARDQFKLALTVDSNSQEANLLLGIVRIFSVVEEGQALNTSGLDSVREILELSGAIIQNFNIYGSTMQMGKGPASTTPRTGAILDFLKNKAIPEVDAAITNLLKVTDPAIQYEITPAAIAQNSGSNISVDYADAMVVKSLLYALKCNLELLMVYGLDVSIPSIYDNPDQLMTYKSFFQQDATLLTPKDPARLTTAKSALISFIDTYTNDAAPRLISRAGGGHHLFVVDAPVGNEPVSFASEDLTDITSKLAEVKAALSGPHLFSFVKDQDRNRTVDLSRFFNANAPINIRTSLTNCGAGTVLPDSTFNGLFPLGIDGHQQFVAEEGGDLLGVTCVGKETPAVKIDPDQIYFNNQSGYYYDINNQFFQPGYSSGPQVVTISSYGTAPLNVSSISLGGANSGDFTLTAGTCSSLAPILAAGASCSVVVDMKRPVVAMGNRSAMLQISSNDLSSPLVSSQIQAYLDPSSGGSISGIVLDAKTGEGIQNVTVSIYDGQTNVFIQSTWTNSTGGYAFNSLNAGSYKLFFGSGFPYQPQWYSNKFSQVSADPIVLSTNENKANVNVSLAPPPVTLSYGGVYHVIKADGSQWDYLDAGINSNSTSLAGMNLTVAGPNGFSYTFSDADKNPAINGQLAVYKPYPANTPLAPGVYTFTLNDGNGHISSRVDTHVTVAAPLPRVDSATIQYQRKADGSYRFSWATVNDARTYYYRLRVALNDSAKTPIYNSTRDMVSFVDLPAGVLVNGTAYLARVEVSDAPSFDLVTNRSDSSFTAGFTPQSGDYDPNRQIFSYASANNQVESDGTQKVAFGFGFGNSAAAATVTSAVLTGPAGFTPYTFQPADLLQPNAADFYKSFETAPLGTYKFDVVANGIHHYAYATLTSAVVYPLPDGTSYRSEDLGNGSIRFSWADVNYSGALYYRVQVKDNVTGRYYNSQRLNQAYADVAKSSLGDPANLMWRVEVFDSANANTQRNRRNGAWTAPGSLASLPAFDAGRPVISSFGIMNETLSNGTSATNVWMGAYDSDGSIVELRVEGPGNYTRNLLTQGKPDGTLFRIMETGNLQAGLYKFTAVDNAGKTSVRFNLQAAAHSIPVVDSKTVTVTTEPNGDARLSWAPVASDVPLWYIIHLFTNTDGDINRQPDLLNVGVSTIGQLITQSSVVIPVTALPQTQLFFRISAYDGSNFTTHNNRSKSVVVGFEGAGFNYASLPDADGDGYASNVDANDSNASVYPFSSPLITAFSIPGTVNGLTVPVSTFTAVDDRDVTGWCLVETNSSAACVWKGTVPVNYTFAAPGAKTLYAFVRDAASNVSSSVSAQTTISSSYPLTLNFAGTGTGSVNGDMSCSKGNSCPSGSFDGGTVVTLMPTAGSDSIFKGWSGDCTNSIGNCVVTMNGQKSVTANFDIMPVVWIPPGTAATNYYGLLTNAYGAAAAGSSILAKAYTFIENLTLNRGIGITIKGGYNAGYVGNVGGYSILDGVLTIESGSLVVEGLAIQ